MTSSKWEKHRREAVLDRLTSFAEELKRMRHRQWQIAVETAALQEELTHLFRKYPQEKDEAAAKKVAKEGRGSSSRYKVPYITCTQDYLPMTVLRIVDFSPHVVSSHESGYSYACRRLPDLDTHTDSWLSSDPDTPEIAATFRDVSASVEAKRESGEERFPLGVDDPSVLVALSWLQTDCLASQEEFAQECEYTLAIQNREQG